MLNMIKLLYFACAVLFENSEIKRTTITLPPEVAADIQKAIKVCVSKEEVPEIIRIIRDGEFRQDQAFKNMIHCIIEEAGYMTEDGKRVNIDKASSIFPNKDIMKKILSECDKNIISDEDYCFEFYKCFQENSPYRMSL